MRERHATASGSGTTLREVGGEPGARCRRKLKAKIQADVIYGAGIKACGKGTQRQAALAPLCETLAVKLEPDVVEMWKAMMEPDVSYSAEVRASEKGTRRQTALASHREKLEVKLEPAVAESWKAKIEPDII